MPLLPPCVVENGETDPIAVERVRSFPSLSGTSLMCQVYLFGKTEENNNICLRPQPRRSSVEITPEPLVVFSGA